MTKHKRRLMPAPKRAATPWDNLYPTSGYTKRHTKSGFAVVTVSYWANEDYRDPEWIKAREREQPNRADFRREYLNDWTSPAGNAYYPEFWQYGGHDTYVVSATAIIPNEPILRCWDFGFFRPACVWMQRDRRRNRIWVLRELMPGWTQIARPEDGIDIRSFRDTVLYLSGELPLGRLSREALRLVSAIADEARYPTPPWFNSGAIPQRFLDFGGPEANKMADEPSAETQARTRAMILAESNIFLSVQTEPWEGREDMIRELLRIRACEFEHDSCPGHPGVVFDPACPVLIEGVAGGITFQKGTTLNPCPASPAKNGYHDHLHDAFSYGVWGSSRVSLGPPPPLDDPTQFVGRRRLSHAEQIARRSTSGLWERFDRQALR